jgi:hypothetical protein
LIKARDLFLALETSPIAPNDEFQRFVVGQLLEDSFIRLKIIITDMLSGKQPSRFQLIVGQNGNGKTLLSNRVKRFLSDENETPGPLTQPRVLRGFDLLYADISALSQASSQTSLEIVTSLRRSQFEDPEITYSLLAVQIVREFAAQYQPPFLWRLVRLVGRAGLDILSQGVYGKFEEALRDKSAEGVRRALDDLTEKFQKGLTKKHYRQAFETFIGDLIGFEPFVKTYFDRDRGIGVHRLRMNFLGEVNRTPSLQQPKEVVEQLGRLTKRAGCRVIVVIIDDCNQLGFIDQLLPLIGDLSRFSDPRVFLIVNMVESTAEKIRAITGDRSGPQRLFYNEPIRLAGPTPQEVEALYGRLKVLYNEAFSGEVPGIPDDNALRAGAVSGWAGAVRAQTIEANYRSAIGFLIAKLREQGHPQSPRPRPNRRR